MVRIVLIILSVFILEKAAHASFSVPDNMLGVKRILFDFRRPLKDKLLQLRQNFIERKYKQGTRFVSNEIVTCPFGVKVQPLENIVNYSYTQDISKDVQTGKVTTIENRTFRGCAKKKTLTERIKVIGDKSYAASEKDILQGNLNLTMDNGGREIIDYRMFDSDGNQVMRLYSKINGKYRFTNYYFGSDKFMQILYEKKNDKLDIKYRFFPFDFILNRNGFQFSTKVGARSQGYFRAFVYKSGAIEYFDDKGVQVSLASFQKNFQINGINFIMNSILIEFPVTDFVNTGGDSARLKEELRNAQTWLIGGNPAQLNLVRNLIEEYLQAVDKGLLVDKRPRGQ